MKAHQRLEVPVGLRTFVVVGIGLLAGHSMGDQEDGYNLKQLEQTIRAYDDEIIETQTAKSWDYDY